MERNEPYPQAHAPWEPFSIDQIFDYITIQTAKHDSILFESMVCLVNRGLRGTDYSFAIINMCQSADAIIQSIMRNTNDV